MDWQAIATIMAVILTALFAWVGYAARTNNERKKILSSTLFNLLGIWRQLHIQNSFDASQISDAYIEEIQKQMPNIEISESDSEVIKQFMKAAGQTLLAQLVARGEDSIEDSFQQSIKQLAEVEPLLAFSLISNRSIKSAISEIDSYLKFSISALANEEGEKTKAEAMRGEVRKYMHDDAIRDLEKDSISLSFKIDIPTFIKTTYLLKIKKNKNSDIKKDIAKLVSELVIPHLVNFELLNLGNEISTSTLTPSPPP